MARSKAEDHSDEPTEDTADSPAEAATEPSEARKRFLAGDLSWNDYVRAEQENG